MIARKPARSAALLAGGGLVAALVAGCGGGGGGSGASPGSAGSGPSTMGGGSPEATASASASPTSAKPPKGSAGAGRLIAAGTTALNKVGHGTVTSIDAEHGGRIWEVDVVTGGGAEHEVHVSRDGSAVVSGPRTKHEDADDRAENQREVRGAKLGYRAAAKKILAARHGRMTELNLDEERGRVVWESDVHHGGTKYEVTIDAASGKVIKNRPDRDDDD